MPDLRNAAVALTLAGQDLVDLLNRGDDAKAAELAEKAAELAAYIAGELTAPVNGASG